jgi:hypothetical protein
MNPSNSTVASAAIGIPVAVVVAWALKEFAGVEVPGTVEAALGAVLSTAIGYFFKGGQSAHTE